eukprot:243400-Rhodomonas_salina.1
MRFRGLLESCNCLRKHLHLVLGLRWVSADSFKGIWAAFGQSGEMLGKPSDRGGAKDDGGFLVAVRSSCPKGEGGEDVRGRFWEMSPSNFLSQLLPAQTL